ncbi:translocation/assembly module TamB domain-containing protein [Aestuariicoccus sp. MJ-SS9]|uniref:translocation/assembly module TamB domain-containing protein n=1 Tax=Aestuariicoccus sp. MJ-SS9 TaxID=3079855 RepID=UPI002911A7BC|nr:translocation/assembly module TamB domain-containing protein [Aestuariicoccus sp. MJ-SS9]MDU8910402.1 translocation/assembly module TamB domain-containing protein [Aestuariicoccus sp. MJ-SS9]
MRFLAALLLALFAFALPAQAQDDQDDRGYLQGLLEDALSDAGREVRIVGFEGALSSEATIQEMTIADGEGIWLRLQDVVLVWNRRALFSARIQVDELTATTLDVLRAPVPASDLPPPEASGPFQLPDLPVEVQIGKLAIGAVNLGDSFLGQPISLTVEGSADLAGGEGGANLNVRRIDGPEGQFDLEGRFANETRQLDLKLLLAEGPGGIAATLMSLPGTPPVRLSVEGSGPLGDFGAGIALATDGQERITGTVALRGAEDGGSAFGVDIAGDIRPLLLPDYHEFFGPRIALQADGAQLADGGLRLDRLALKADAISLDGAVELGPDQWPRNIDVDLRIADATGAPVLLAIPGAETRVDLADLVIRYDAERDDGWSAEGRIDGLTRPDLSIGSIALNGSGRIRRGDGVSLGEVSGSLNLDTGGIALADPALAQAVGDSASGALSIDWQPGAPLRIADIALSAAGARLTGNAALAGVDGGVDLNISGDLGLIADDISRFSGLAGRDLGGSVDVVATVQAQPVSGSFDVDLKGRATDLATSIPEADRLLAGSTQLRLSARRDTGGTVLRDFAVDGDFIDVTAQAELRSGASAGRFDLTLPDLSVPLPDLPGRANLTGTFRETDAAWLLDVMAEGPGAARFDGDVSLAKAETGLGPIAADGQLSVGALADFAAVAQRNLGGAVDLAGQVTFDPAGNALSAVLDGSATDLAVAIDPVDRLLRGETRLRVDVDQAGPRIAINELFIDGQAIDLTAEGVIEPDASAARFDLSVPDVSVPLPQLSGPLRLNGTAREDAAKWDLALDATAPGDSRFDGTVTLEKADGEIVAVDADGALALNRLAAYAGLAGRALGGAVRLDGGGRYDLRDGSASARLTGRAEDIATGIATVDALTRGATDLTLDARRNADGTLIFDTLDLGNPQLTADLTGSLGPTRSRLRFDVLLRNLGLVAPGFDGPASARGTAQRDTGDWTIDTALTGPGGTEAQANGTLAPGFDRANLSLAGQAPLGLANRFIEPRLLTGLASFDLALNGPLALSSVSGSVRSTGAEFILPTMAQALRDMNVDVALSGGRASVSVDAQPAKGGRIEASGPITLSAPFPADLTIALIGVQVEEPGLFETSVDGRLTFSGPLTGGARLGGRIDLGTVEVRIPETGLGGPSRAFELTHVNEPAPVRSSRARAGLLEEGTGGSGVGGGGGAVYPLDLTINAPARIFIRGRGLDAELGGQLRVTGSTAEVVPQGRFDLIRGRLDLLGQRLLLSEGYAQLQGDFDPYLRLQADAERDETVIRIIVQGLASSPDVVITSVPERPEEEVLALLLFGRDVTDISALQALRIAAAVNTLAGRGGGGIVDRLRMGFGLDELDLETNADGTTDLRVGKYLSDNVYTDVTVGATGDTEINLNLSISKSVTARGSVGSDGDTSVGIFFEKDY